MTRLAANILLAGMLVRIIRSRLPINILLPTLCIFTAHTGAGLLSWRAESQK